MTAASRTHVCYAPACRSRIPNRRMFCPSHWRRLPAKLKRPILGHYREGQEIEGRPTKEYIAAVRTAIEHYERRVAAGPVAPRLFGPDAEPPGPGYCH